MTTAEKITDTVWCTECQADVTLERDAMGFWVCSVCGLTPQNIEGTRYDDDDVANLLGAGADPSWIDEPEGWGDGR